MIAQQSLASLLASAVAALFVGMPLAFRLRAHSTMAWLVALVKASSDLAPWISSLRR